MLFLQGLFEFPTINALKVAIDNIVRNFNSEPEEELYTSEKWQIFVATLQQFFVERISPNITAESKLIYF